ncbi:MAG TPA: leucine-rich repeat domain-containing protein [Candidatus Saccharimonadales bacterium]|nr:leucine-rich repeat domain-containing protein [Candidatus Saccharimonadales bacterium]
METYKQIQNPDSGRFIYIDGPTYKKLLKKYNENVLLLQPIRTTHVAPRKIKSTIVHHRQVDLNKDVLREILSHADIQSVFRLCQVNKTLCHQQDDLFRHIYDRFYHETGMAVLKTANMTWFQLLKLCYQLSRLILLLPSLKKYTMIALYKKKELSLSAKKIKVLPPEIGQLSHLQKLYLNGNQLSSLPPEMSRLSSLQQLLLNNNQLGALPPEMGRLSALQTLDLSNNQLSALPQELCQLIHLKYLNLAINKLIALPPEMGQMHALQLLNLSYNQLSALQPEISQLSALQQLDLSYNQLTALPPEIGQLINLKYLYLSNNNFSSAFINKLIQQLPNTKIIF